MEIAEMLLEAKADADKADNDGLTALHAVAQTGCPRLTQLLLDAKADKDRRTHDGKAALHLAIVNCHTRVVQMLLKAGEARRGERWGNCYTFGRFGGPNRSCALVDPVPCRHRQA